MLDSVIKVAMGATRVLPAIEMLRDFSEAAEAEAKAGAIALFGLGSSSGAGIGFLIGAATLGGLSHFAFAGAFLAACAPCAYAALVFKKRLDQTRAKLEQLRGAALASRAAKAIGNRAVDMVVAAAGAAVSAGRATSRASEAAAHDAIALPVAAYGAAAEAASSAGKAVQTKASAAMEVASAAAQALSDPATRKAAADLAGEAINGLARGAGFAAGWLKSKKAASPAAIAAPPAAIPPAIVVGSPEDKRDQAGV